MSDSKSLGVDGLPVKTTGLISELASVPVIVIIIATISASFYIFELRSGLASMSDKVASLENELDSVAGRKTEIAQLGWQLGNTNDAINRLTVQVESSQEQIRALQSTIRDLLRDTK